MKIIRDVLSVSLLSSGLFGIAVLVNDKWLWSVALSHAYGLIGFVFIDLVLVGATLKRVGLAAFAAAFLAVLQFGAMLADLLAGAPMGTPSAAFRNYLLSDSSYLGLLFIQIAIAIVSIGGLAAPRFQRRVRLSSLPHFPRH
jgi:hypothetical protein